MTMTPPDRRVITFYSFKGGVGRTMALANVAYRLANKHGLKVIAVDWDLEAPGLHRFFGLSSERVAEARGVLDYFEAWQGALERKDPEAPRVIDWIIPIIDQAHAPRFGSLSLLVAGRLDEGYDRRLAAFNWQTFYGNDAGASAVETLREQLVDKADVVLIDSRTGFTDAGGICTIQIPDGVVLMMGTNQQSLEGTQRVARSIASATTETRAGRERSKAWLVMSRVPSVEETYLAERWFAANESWFKAGVELGLWCGEDHPEGIESYKIPHRGRWAFDETVLNEATKHDPRDELAIPYDRFAETLLRWLRGEPPVGLEHQKATKTIEGTLSSQDIETQRADVADAERRGDIFGLALALRNLSLALLVADRHDEAIRRMEQASGIFVSRGARAHYWNSLLSLGSMLNAGGRYSEAEQTLAKALDIARELGSQGGGEALVLTELARTRFEMGARDEAAKVLLKAYAIIDSTAEKRSDAWILVLIGNRFLDVGMIQEAIEAFRHSLRVARTHADADAEKHALRWLLSVPEAGGSVPDAPALHARLDELSATQPVSK